MLILDGDTRLRGALHANFLRHGWQVKAAGMLREAFRAFDQQAFNLVISDAILRDGDVYEVLAALQGSLPATPVIVLAAEASVSAVVQLMRAGAFDVLARDTCFDLLQMSARNAIRTFGADQKASAEGASEDSGPQCFAVPAAGMTLSELSRRHLEDALMQTEGNRTNAAKVLGISVRTVRNKIRQYGLPPRSYA